jgi:hypothetical protein
MDTKTRTRNDLSRARLANLALGTSALVFAAALSTTAWTQAPAPVDAALVRAVGTWELAITEAEARARMDRGIAQGVDGLPPIVDGIAAGRLRENISLSQRIEIALSPTRIGVRFDNSAYDTAPGETEVYPLTTGSAETIDVVQHITEGRLQQVFTTPQGRRWNTFSISADGNTLNLDVVVQSDRLPAPVRYTLQYRRASTR